MSNMSSTSHRSTPWHESVDDDQRYEDDNYNGGNGYDDDNDDDDDDDYNVIKPGLGQHVSQPQKMAYFSVLKPFYF